MSVQALKTRSRRTEIMIQNKDFFCKALDMPLTVSVLDKGAGVVSGLQDGMRETGASDGGRKEDGGITVACRFSVEEEDGAAPAGDSDSTAGYSAAACLLTVRNSSDAAWCGIIRCSTGIGRPAAEERPFFLLPSFLYGTNRAGEAVHPKAKQWPRIRPGAAEPPFAGAFCVRADRLTHPGAMLRWGGGFLCISGPQEVRKAAPCAAADGEFSGRNSTGRSTEARGRDRPAAVSAGFGCFWEETRAGLIYTLGYRNEPWCYAGGGIKRDEPGEELLRLGPGEELSVSVRIEAADAGAGIKNIGLFAPALRRLYRGSHEAPRRITEARTAAADLAGAMYRDAYNEDARNYCTTLRCEEGRVVQDTGSFSISWTGGTQAAVPLLMAGLRLEDDDITAQAGQCVEAIVDESLNPRSGLPYDAFRDGTWTVNGWWNEYVWSLEGKGGHSSYLVGEALYYILKAYDYEKKLGGREHADWIGFTEQVLTRIEDTKSREGEYPYRWSEETGEALEYDSFCGAWSLAARSYLALLTGNNVLLSGCAESLTHYHESYVKKMLCYGAPHDTWKAVDQEGILAFVKAACLLHRTSGDEAYLTALRDGLDYEFSWKYCLNTNPKIQPLSRIGWSSRGGSVTSVANQCVHPMGNIIADEILYYYRASNDEYYLQRYKDTVLWGLQTYNRYDSEYDHGLKGWLSERFDASPVTSLFTYPDGRPAGTWFVYHPWAAGCILESIAGEGWEAGLL